jgi:hypothetical protein
MNHGAAVTVAAGAQTDATSKRAFARHFGEMMLAMVLGMVVLGGLAELAFTAAGTGLSDQPGALRVAMMGAYMTVPMVIWMAHRGHSIARNAEMAGAMIVPSLLAAGLVVAGALDTAAAFGVQHVVMIPAMLGVMLWRYAEYAHPHAG